MHPLAGTIIFVISMLITSLRFNRKGSWSFYSDGSKGEMIVSTLTRPEFTYCAEFRFVLYSVIVCHVFR